MRGGRTVCASVLLALTQGASSLAQAPADQPTFRAGTTVVEFTVVVTDAAGKPVSDLQQRDITIIENGQPRDVAFFHFEGAPPAAIRIRTQPLPPGIYTNRPEYAPGPPRNITAIVIDALNTRADDQTRVLAHLLAFVAAVPSDTRVAIYRTGERIRIVHDFTDDLETLRQRLTRDGLEAPRDVKPTVAVQTMMIEPWQAEAMSATMEASLEVAYDAMAGMEERSNQIQRDKRHELTLQSLEAIGNHLAGIPGRKNLIWMTGGVPMIAQEGRDPWPANFAPAMRKLAQRLATQGVAMYPVEAAGVRPPYLNVNADLRGSTRGVEDVVAAGTDAIGRAASRVEGRIAARGGPPRSLSSMSTSPDMQRTLSTNDLFADLTGGRSLKNTNDLLAGLKAAAGDMRGTYSIGFYAPREPDDRWHTFTVKVARPDVKVVHRQGYLSSAATKQSELWLADQWRAAASNPLGSATVRLDARFELKDNVVYSILQIPGEDLHFTTIDGKPTCLLEVAIAERTPQGLLGIRHEQGSFAIQEAQARNRADVAVRFRKNWTLDPKTSLIRIVIRDRHTGQYGTLDVPIAALR